MIINLIMPSIDLWIALITKYMNEYNCSRFLSGDYKWKCSI